MGKKAGAWILAGELQETNRMYARTIAKIVSRNGLRG
ncbi:MAG TPA: hypothetical protein DCW35_04055 [Polynucleobacter sp.]|nr:hypothetical protein [Polynucleobacter sp.]